MTNSDSKFIFDKKTFVVDLNGKTYFSHKCHKSSMFFPGGSLGVGSMDRGGSLRGGVRTFFEGDAYVTYRGPKYVSDD